MYAKLSRSAAIRGQLDKVTPHRGESHGNEKHTHTQTLSAFCFLTFEFCLINILYCMCLTTGHHELHAMIVIHYSLSSFITYSFASLIFTQIIFLIQPHYVIC